MARGRRLAAKQAGRRSTAGPMSLPRLSVLAKAAAGVRTAGEHGGRQHREKADENEQPHPLRAQTHHPVPPFGTCFDIFAVVQQDSAFQERISLFMRVDLAVLRRRALGLQRAGLFSLAERAFGVWWAAADAREHWNAVAEAAMCAVRLAVDRNRPSAALTIGARALPLVLGRPRTDPDVMGRMFIILAKAAWSVGQDADLQAFADAARCIVESEPVEPLVRVHYGIVRSMTAIDGEDLNAADAWLLQSLDIAQTIGNSAASDLCRSNLAYVCAERGLFDRAYSTISELVAPGAREPEMVGALVNGVHIALGRDDLTEAGRLAQRAVQAYCAAPSMLSPINVAYLFDALAGLHAGSGALRAAELLGATARAWFAVCNRRRDVLRLEAWLADLPNRGTNLIRAGGQVDPESLYLGELYDAAYKAPNGTLAEALATSVHYLLKDVDPVAPPVASEHAALLRGLAPTERWFTGRSEAGRAAERLLSEPTAPGRAGLELLAAYERFAADGASWPDTLRGLKRANSDPAGVRALDRLYRNATA